MRNERGHESQPNPVDPTLLTVGSDKPDDEAPGSEAGKTLESGLPKALETLDETTAPVPVPALPPAPSPALAPSPAPPPAPDPGPPVDTGMEKGQLYPLRAGPHVSSGPIRNDVVSYRNFVPPAPPAAPASCCCCAAGSSPCSPHSPDARALAGVGFLGRNYPQYHCQYRGRSQLPLLVDLRSLGLFQRAQQSIRSLSRSSIDNSHRRSDGCGRFCHTVRYHHARSDHGDTTGHLLSHRIRVRNSARARHCICLAMDHGSRLDRQLLAASGYRSLCRALLGSPRRPEAPSAFVARIENSRI